MKRTGKSTQPVESKVIAAIRGHGRGCFFVPADFLNLGSREAIDIALHRLTQNGTALASNDADFDRVPGITRFAPL